MMRVMPFAAAAVALMLVSCATAGDPKPAVCDGKHRRPANPYGSVLPIAPAAASSSTPSGAPAPPKPLTGPAPAPGPQSSIDPKSVLPCGDRA